MFKHSRTLSALVVAAMSGEAAMEYSQRLLPQQRHYGAGKPSLKRKTRGKGQRKF